MSLVRIVSWRDVDESQPEDGYPVLVATQGGGVLCAYFRGLEHGEEPSMGIAWSLPDGFPLYRQTVTHWMPMPKGPKP